MKKTLFVTAAVVAMTVAGALTGAQTVAAGSASGSTNAEFTVDAGSGGTDGGDHGTDGDENLILNKIPDLHFMLNGANPKVGDIIAGTTLRYADGVTKQTGDKAEVQDGSIEVLDYRGTNAGWKLSAKVGKPTNGTTTLEGTLTLAAAISKFTNVGATGTVGGAMTAGGDNVQIWQAKAAVAGTDADHPATPGEGTGANDATVGAGTSFKLTPNASATTGQYDALVTWTLAGTPEMN
ncbi:MULTISPECIES: WxL domain-containing protein [unclassified Lacticaseibacillus]|uniref:WxL domain-containing protein n=1 Tax=unclassified Lacticaseibacillus TaxID=2759744 RepID=UPI001944125B|nr:MULTISPECIES: WxL domain-containing protein [unclassified Lacticaseibacillus]